MPLNILQGRRWSKLFLNIYFLLFIQVHICRGYWESDSDKQGQGKQNGQEMSFMETFQFLLLYLIFHFENPGDQSPAKKRQTNNSAVISFHLHSPGHLKSPEIQIGGRVHQCQFIIRLNWLGESNQVAHPSQLCETVLFTQHCGHNDMTSHAIKWRYHCVSGLYSEKSFQCFSVVQYNLNLFP